MEPQSPHGHMDYNLWVPRGHPQLFVWGVCRGSPCGTSRLPSQHHTKQHFSSILHCSVRAGAKLGALPGSVQAGNRFLYSWAGNYSVLGMGSLGRCNNIRPKGNGSLAPIKGSGKGGCTPPFPLIKKWSQGMGSMGPLVAQRGGPHTPLHIYKSPRDMGSLEARGVGLRTPLPKYK